MPVISVQVDIIVLYVIDETTVSRDSIRENILSIIIISYFLSIIILFQSFSMFCQNVAICKAKMRNTTKTELSPQVCAAYYCHRSGVLSSKSTRKCAIKMIAS